MTVELADLWRWRGKISRARFVVWGLVLFALKYNLDRILLRVVFDEEWSWVNYFRHAFPWMSRSPSEAPKQYALLLAAALPFLWVGLALSLKRLRSAGLPLWLAALFVVPVLKWFLFLVLGLVPARGSEENGVELERGRGLRWLPTSALGSAALAVAASALLALGGALFGASYLHDYGWGLFVGVPFCMGFLAVLIFGAGHRRALRENIGVAFLSVLLSGLLLLVFAAEGLICILMAAPLALALAGIGAMVGHAVQAVGRRDTRPELFCVPVLAVPVMFGGEILRNETPDLLRVSTTVEVDAPCEQVWQNVISFSELPPPRENIFRLGIAYPVRAEIQGRGVGAVRLCMFSTGPFVEPIEVWDEPRLLRFSVSENPEPMRELTLYHAIHPPHLNGFLVSKQGQFQLTELPGGRTRLEGTTWYQHSMWPAGYWQFWSDGIIHAIHSRVLNHVKKLSENDAADWRKNGGGVVGTQ